MRISNNYGNLRKKRASRAYGVSHIRGSCIDPRDQSNPLDPALKAPRASGAPTIRLLKNDFCTTLLSRGSLCKFQ